MKKTISAIFSICALASLLFFACKKSEGEGVAPTYASEGTSTGGNPNVTTTSGTTSGSTTSSTTSGSTTSGTTTSGTTTSGTTTSGTTTSGTTTGGTTTGCNYTLNGTSYNGTCLDNSGSACNSLAYNIKSVSGSNNCIITFSMNCPSTPAAGTYTVVQGTPAANQCAVLYMIGSGNWVGTGGTVTVSTVSGKLQFVFNSIPVEEQISSATGTGSGTLTQP